LLDRQRRFAAGPRIRLIRILPNSCRGGDAKIRSFGVSAPNSRLMLMTDTAGSKQKEPK